MSRPFRIRVTRDVSRVVHVEDGVTSHLEMLPILEAARMRGLLEAQLVSDGFDVEGTVASKEIEPGLFLEVDIATSAVALKLQGEHILEERIDTTAYGDTDFSDREQLERDALEKAEGRVQKKMDKQAKELQQKASARLEGKLRDLRGEINRITGEVTKAALKEKASSMGDIDALSEGTDGSMEIKVKL